VNLDLTQSRLKEVLDYNFDTGVFKWKIQSNHFIQIGDDAGCVSKGYITIAIDNCPYMAHRLVWLYIYGKFPDKFIDHINGIKSDNRLINLREANNTQNLQNIGLHKSNTSGYKGVYFHKKKKQWMARCRVNGVRIYLGMYPTAEEASKVYDAFAKENFGEFYKDLNIKEENATLPV
jgi:hypothetical protein